MEEEEGDGDAEEEELEVVEEEKYGSSLVKVDRFESTVRDRCFCCPPGTDCDEIAWNSEKMFVTRKEFESFILSCFWPSFLLMSLFRQLLYQL